MLVHARCGTASFSATPKAQTETQFPVNRSSPVQIPVIYFGINLYSTVVNIKLPNNPKKEFRMLLVLLLP
jgi:hypothetical protein